MSDSLRPHGLQNVRLPCPSPSPGVHSDSCPLSQWCIQPSHPLSLSSPTFNLSQHQGLFHQSCLLSSDGQTIVSSASALVLPMNIQGWLPFGLTGLISCSPRGSQESSPTPLGLRWLFWPGRHGVGMREFVLRRAVQVAWHRSLSPSGVLNSNAFALTPRTPRTMSIGWAKTLAVLQMF